MKKMAPWVKCLLCEHENWIWISSIHVKLDKQISPSTVVCIFNIIRGGQSQANLLDNLARAMSSRLTVGELVSKIQGESTRGSHATLTPDLHPHIY